MDKKKLLIEEFNKISPNCSRCYEFVKHMKETDYCYLDQIGLILLTPETFFTRKVHDLIKQFVEDGLTLLDCCLLDHLTSEESSSMFIPEWIPSEFRWWLFSMRYEMGAVVAFLVYKNRCNNIHEELKRLKGNRIFAESKVGTWRHDFKAINAVFNYVHCADDFAYVLRNSIPFFSTKRIVEAIYKIKNTSVNRSVDANNWENAYETHLSAYEQADIRDINFMDLYLSLIQKILLNQELTKSMVDVIKNIYSYRKSFSMYNKENIIVLTQLISKIESALPEESYYYQLFGAIRNKQDNINWDKYFKIHIDPYYSMNNFSRTILISTLFYAEQELRYLRGATCL